MSNYRIALRYDKSLLRLAVDKGVLEEVHDDMQALDKLCRESRPFLLMLRSPVIGNQKKLSVIEAIFKGKLHELTLGIFEIMARRNRVNILPELAAVFHEQYNSYKGIAEATVTTAVELDESQRKAFADIVQERSGAKEVALKEVVDEEIIGGYILKVGDKQIDDSISTRIKELKHKFAS